MRKFENYIVQKWNVKRFKDIRSFKESGICDKYTHYDLENDLTLIRESFSEKFVPNAKLLEELKIQLTLLELAGDDNTNLVEQIKKLEDRIWSIIVDILEARPRDCKPSLILWDVSRWVANNGIDPAVSFKGNVDTRWTNIFKKIGYDG